MADTARNVGTSSPAMGKVNGGHQQHEMFSEDPNMSATEKARLRASKLSAKLAAAGKYQTKPLSLLVRIIF